MSCKKPDIAQRLRRMKTERDMKKMGIKENCDEKKKKKGRKRRKEKKKGCANVKRCKKLCEEKDKKRRRYVTL